jgi:hypothetical protein
VLASPGVAADTEAEVEAEEALETKRKFEAGVEPEESKA